MLICGLGSVPKDCGTQISKTNFAPRLGIAWRPGSTLSEGIPDIKAPELGNGIIDIPAAYALTSTGDRFVRSYIQSWNLTVQKQFARNLTGQIGYVATRQVHQSGNLDLNAGQIPGAGRNGQPYFLKFGRTTQTALLTPIGHTSYNSLQSTLDRRFSKGVSLQ